MLISIVFSQKQETREVMLMLHLLTKLRVRYGIDTDDSISTITRQKNCQPVQS